MSNDVLAYALLLAHGDRETTDRLRAFIDDPSSIEEPVEEDYRPGKQRRLFDRWLYESGSRTPPRPGLVWKDSTKRWVRPDSADGASKKPKADKPQAEPKTKKLTAAQQKKVAREAAVTAARELIADPSKLTPDHLPGLAANLGHLSQSELKETAKRLSAKVGGTKSALAERIVAALKLQKELTTDPRTKAIASVLERHRNGDIDLAEAVEAIKSQHGSTAPAAKAEPAPIDRTNGSGESVIKSSFQSAKQGDPISLLDGFEKLKSSMSGSGDKDLDKVMKVLDQRMSYLRDYQKSPDKHSKLDSVKLTLDHVGSVLDEAFRLGNKKQSDFIRNLLLSIPGVTEINQEGDYDLKLHKPIGDIVAGVDSVEIVQPGFTWSDGKGYRSLISPAKVKKAEPDAPSQSDPARPEETGFTGVAGNGVRYVNGVPQKKQDEAPIDRTNDALDDFFAEPTETPKPSEPEGDLRDNALLDDMFGEPAEPEPKPEPKPAPKTKTKTKAEPKPEPEPAPAPKKAALPPEKRGIHGGHILPYRDPKFTAIGNEILDSGADEAITNAYNHLTDFGRFESGIVDFPSLFRHVQKTNPELTDYQLKLAILAMDGTGAGGMQDMNETNMFSKEDKAYMIEDEEGRRGAYYFIVSPKASEGGKGSPKIDLAKLRALRGKK